VDEDRRLTGFDHEEGSAARALLDDSFPSRKTALLEESRNLLDLMLGQIREQGHTLQDLNGRASHHRPSQASPAARQRFLLHSKVMEARCRFGCDALWARN